VPAAACGLNHSPAIPPTDAGMIVTPRGTRNGGGVISFRIRETLPPACASLGLNRRLSIHTAI